jgi:hypothetical protein
MLQRIQTVFLVLAAAAMLTASSTALTTFYFNSEIVVFEAMGIYVNDTLNESTWGLFALGLISSVLALSTIFLYKNRILQIRLSIFNIILMIGFYLFFGFITYRVLLLDDIHFNKIGIGVIMPIIAIILTVLAIRKIGEDEALVQSLNRLRG